MVCANMKLRNFERPHAFEALRNEVEEKNQQKPALVDASNEDDFRELCHAARRYGVRWVDQRKVKINVHQE